MNEINVVFLVDLVYCSYINENVEKDLKLLFSLQVGVGGN